MAASTVEKSPVGLPMDLAETNNVRPGFKWFSAIHKTLSIIILILFAVGFYVLIMRLLQSSNEISRTEIILVSELNEKQNGTIFKDDVKIILQIKNKTSTIVPIERKKRDTSLPHDFKLHSKDGNIKFRDNQIQKARKIITEHDVLCNDDTHKDVCKDLVRKLRTLTENNFSDHRENKENENTKYEKDLTSVENLKEASSTEVSEGDELSLLRPTKSVPIEKDASPYGSYNEMNNMPPFSNNHGHEYQNPQYSDSCLTSHLMKPNLHSGYDNMYPEHKPQHSRPFSNYGSHYGGYSREVEEPKMNPHPQDIEIAMKFIAPKSDMSSKEEPSNSSISVIECPIGYSSCNNGNLCIDDSKWCDGNVDCDDVSDESRCSCKSRVDMSRICDGYFDCPFGEDEMGCFGCAENTFSCEDQNLNSKSTCFTKEQRCNNVLDCPNHKDEIDCSMLAPSLHKKPLFAVSNTEGFLHRNFKGNWYAVCSNPYMWAHEACRRETGLIIRPPYIQSVEIDPLIKVKYLNTAPGGLIHTSNTCGNSSAVYVTCRDLLCGTRVSSTSQLLREHADMEENLFGRNKRYLFQRSPYPVMFYGNRAKRYATNNKLKANIPLSYLKNGKNRDVRFKRAESRVVGGKPSQPAAWPWMVALYRNGMFHCGGVIINQNWIMSAAHCVHKFWEHYYEVQVGMLRRFSFSPQEQNHRVTHVIVNQNYNQQDMKNDLSLLRVKPGIQFSRWVRPICLPGPEVAGADWMWGPAAGTICTAVGWGATVEKGPDPDHMREVEVPIWEHCKHKEDQAGNEICAGLAEGGRDSCQGDSGGPLLCKNPANPQQWYVAGIVSHGDGCARKGEPGVYTLVSVFVSWIRYHTASKALPLIQPKQECPGFRCDSGILKCLPKKRMCDKIIDCLDGEDELNCEFVKSPNTAEKTLLMDTLSEETNMIEKTTKISNINDISTNEGLKPANHNIKQGIGMTGKQRNNNLIKNGKDTTLSHDAEINGTDYYQAITVTTENTMIPNNKNITNLIKNRKDTTLSHDAEINNTDYYQAIPVTTEDTMIPNNKNITNSIKNGKDTTLSHDAEINGTEYYQPIPVTTENTMIPNNKNITNLIKNGKDTTLSHDAEINGTEYYQAIPVTTENTMIPNNKNITTTIPMKTIKIMKTNKISSDASTLYDDMKHASTIEMPNLDYFQDTMDDSDPNESQTMDPITALKTNQEFEQKVVNIDTPKIAIESMSGMENIKQKDLQIVGTMSTSASFDTSALHTSAPLQNTSATIHNDSLDSQKINKEDKNRPNFTDTKQEHILHPLKIDIIPSYDVSNDNLNYGLNFESSTKNNIVDQEYIQTNHINQNLTAVRPIDSNFNNIGETILSELQPANKRKKHLTPTEFQCRRINQIVPFTTRCDHKADCEDGSDELDCTCTDYLTTFDSKLLCDGHFDCADGQDEINCYTCEEDQFLCKKSELCLDSKYVCDGILNCPLGEDELNCYALTNGNQLLHDINDKPETRLEGYLTKKHHNDWHIVCEDDISIQEQEVAANHICRYLGFSSANRYVIKYVNVKEKLRHMVEKRSKRNIDLRIPVHFRYKSFGDDSNSSHVIKDPQVIKEECVPNITKTCMALYVFCDHSLYTHFNGSQEIQKNKEIQKISDQMWPWIAKLYMDGLYKCTGILVDLSWVLVNHVCMQGYELSHHYVTVVLGSHKTLKSSIGPYEQIYQVDAKKHLYRSKVMLLHLIEPATYSSMVKPMTVTSLYTEDTKNSVCVAVGQDTNNKMANVFLKETDKCDIHSRCFVRQDNSSICHIDGSKWAGIISCHNKHGWYPAASFVKDVRDCGRHDGINGTDIGHLKQDIKSFEGKPFPSEGHLFTNCEGVRCQRGLCVGLEYVCNGVTNCEDASDESKEACRKKYDVCTLNPFYRGCECPVGQLKCHNGACVPKELFKDGHDDCGDGTDEPGQTLCSDYLRRVMPSRLCDGILHCHDRSDEDPAFCRCFAKKAYKCTGMSRNEDYCVAPDMVCDGVRDCPNGDDERTCIALSSAQGTPHGIGEVIVRSHGVWYSKCYATQNHTKSELEAICRELGFIGGHAKQLTDPKGKPNPYNSILIDMFSDVMLNNNTIIKLRNTAEPVARAVSLDLQDCYPVFIECL